MQHEWTITAIVRVVFILVWEIYCNYNAVQLHVCSRKSVRSTCTGILRSYAISLWRESCALCRVTLFCEIGMAKLLTGQSYIYIYGDSLSFFYFYIWLRCMLMLKWSSCEFYTYFHPVWKCMEWHAGYVMFSVWKKVQQGTGITCKWQKLEHCTGFSRESLGNKHSGTGTHILVS